MNTTSFRETVKNGLENMKREDIIFFAWLCAVRALPCVILNSNIINWNEKDRQKYLYSVFHALDVCYYYRTPEFSYDACKATKAANNARAFDKRYIKKDCKSELADAAAIASAAANAVDALRAEATNFDRRAEERAKKTKEYAADAAENAAFRNILQSIIIEDMQILLLQKEDEKLKFNTDMYAECWVKFQQELDNVGCAYWGNLYKNIFDNSFELDKDELQRRMNVPESIQQDGAAAVARYLEMKIKS